jgi:hypothetical protein
MAIIGFTRFRKWQFGKQSAFGTAVAASRRLPFRGTLEINPNWTDQEDVDVGSIDPVLPAYRVGADITAAVTAPLDYNTIPLLMAAGVRGGVSGVAGSGSYAWTHSALSLTPTTLDYFTTEWGDDVDDDTFKARDGVLESIEFTLPEDLGPWQVSANWRFGYADHGVTPTAGLGASEVAKWLSADPTNRFVKMLAQSTQEAESGIKYSWDLRLSGTWRTRSDGERGGNSAVTLEMVGRYDGTLTYALRSAVVNTLATLP